MEPVCVCSPMDDLGYLVVFSILSKSFIKPSSRQQPIATLEPAAHGLF